MQLVPEAKVWWKLHSVQVAAVTALVALAYFLSASFRAFLPFGGFIGLVVVLLVALVGFRLVKQGKLGALGTEVIEGGKLAVAEAGAGYREARDAVESRFTPKKADSPPKSVDPMS